MPKRKYKVISRIVTYMWAESRDDAIKYQEELLRKGELGFPDHCETDARFTIAQGMEFIHAPEDISKSRDAVTQPRPLDWLEIHHDGVSVIALVTRLSKKKVYYFEAATRTHRSIERKIWERWSRTYGIHPSYEEQLPPFIVSQIIREHENRGLLSGASAEPDSSLIIEILEEYGYRPNEYEVANGYWAEKRAIESINDHILEKTSAETQRIDSEDDFSISFSESLPTIDDLGDENDR